ncbi:MAG: ABC-2 family transporter protein [Fibrobacteres bacterium]|nr:ABC-2 family transporter protein [Fibrobacterota bacterium]
MINLYWAYFRISLLESLQYRFSILLWLLGNMLQPLIYFSVWHAVLVSRGGSIGGLSSGDFAAYYIIISFINVATSSPFPYRIMEPIQSGRMANILLKPVHFLHTEIATSLGSRTLDMLFMVPPMLFFSFAFDATWTMSPLSVLLCLPAIVFASAIRLLIEGCIGTCAFWAIRAHGFNQAYYLLFFFASGQAAPSGVLPAWLNTVTSFLPFRSMLQFPTDLLLNRVQAGELAWGFLIQLLWIGLFAGLFAFLWKRGVRKFTAVGI